MTNQEYLKYITTELNKPLPYKWKIQGYNKQKTKAMVVAYLDARIVTNRLNEVCIYGWHRDHFMLGTDIYCRVGIVMPDGSVIWRADAGESDNDYEKTKTASSDSYKRAAKEFGLGLFLYELDVVNLKVVRDGDYYNVVREDGSKIWDINKYMNEEHNKKTIPNKKDDDSKSPQKKATPSKQQEASTDSEEAQRKSKALIAIKSLFNGAKFTDDEVLKYIIKVYKKPSLEDLVKQSTLDQLTGIYETLKTKSDSGELNKV